MAAPSPSTARARPGRCAAAGLRHVAAPLAGVRLRRALARRGAPPRPPREPGRAYGVASPGPAPALTRHSASGPPRRRILVTRLPARETRWSSASSAATRRVPSSPLFALSGLRRRRLSVPARAATRKSSYGPPPAPPPPPSRVPHVPVIPTKITDATHWTGTWRRKRCSSRTRSTAKRSPSSPRPAPQTTATTSFP